LLALRAGYAAAVSRSGHCRREMIDMLMNMRVQLQRAGV